METIVALNDNIDTATFYGVNNQNILCLKNQHPDVRIVARGYQIKVSGSEAAVNKFTDNLKKVETFCALHNTLNEEQILQILHGEHPQAVEHDNLILHGVNGKPILARSANQKKLVTDYDSNDLLFAIGPQSLTNTFNYAQRRIDMKPHIRLHDLRHSHASMLINLGFSADVVADRLGHSNAAMVLSIYGHMYPQRRVEVVNALDKAIAERKEKESKE